MVSMFDEPIDAPFKGDIAAARLVPSRMIGDMDVENPVDVPANHLGRGLAHHGGMIDIVDDADLRTPRRLYDLDAFNR